MVNIMTSKKFYALLAVADLFSILLTTWLGILTVPVCVFMTLVVAILLFDKMRPSLRAMVRELFFDDRSGQ